MAFNNPNLKILFLCMLLTQTPIVSSGEVTDLGLNHKKPSWVSAESITIEKTAQKIKRESNDEIIQDNNTTSENLINANVEPKTGNENCDENCNDELVPNHEQQTSSPVMNKPEIEKSTTPDEIPRQTVSNTKENTVVIQSTAKAEATTAIKYTDKTTSSPHCDCESFNNITLTIDRYLLKLPEGANLNLNCSIRSENIDNIKVTIFWTPEHENTEQNATFRILQISNLEIQHSGRYKCTMLSEDNCCNKIVWSSLDVYKIPNYIPMLIIVGAVCLSLLLLCIPLEIARHKQILFQSVDLNAKEDEQPIAFNL